MKPHKETVVIPSLSSGLKGILNGEPDKLRHTVKKTLAAALTGTIALCACGEPFSSSNEQVVDGGSDVGGAGSGGEAGSGGAGSGGEAGSGGGCLDTRIFLHGMTEYEYKLWRGGCTDADTLESSIEPSLQEFETEATELCVKASDTLVVQVRDNNDANSLEFTSAAAPVSVDVSPVANSNPMNNDLFNILCDTTTGYTSYDVTAHDINNLPNEYKYPGNLEMGNLPPSNVFKLKF